MDLKATTEALCERARKRLPIPSLPLQDDLVRHLQTLQWEVDRLSAKPPERSDVALALGVAAGEAWSGKRSLEAVGADIAERLAAKGFSIVHADDKETASNAPA